MKSDSILTVTAAVQSAQVFLTGFLRCIAELAEHPTLQVPQRTDRLGITLPLFPPERELLGPTGY